MTTDLASLAAKLTEAQRRAVLDARDLMATNDGYSFFTVRHTGELWPPGIAQFLTLKTDRLTPLGLSLRAYLESCHDA